ncbi:MAG: DUF620 domain-containing protein [Planctomycetota bacterium]
MKSYVNFMTDSGLYAFFNNPARIIAFFSVFLLLIGSGQASIPDSTDPPEAEAILEMYIKATGGMDAYEKINNRVTESTMEVTGQGLKIKSVIKAAKPDLFYVATESDVMGNSEKGYDGKVVWENSTMQGAMIKEGKEKASFIMLAIFDRTVYWRKAFVKAECKGMEEVNGKPCYKLVMTTKESGRDNEDKGKKEDAGEIKPMVWYIDKESSLLVRIDMTMESAMGALEIESLMNDYRDVDGVLLPFETRIKMMGQERMKSRVTSINQNVELPPDTFALPEEVRMLLKKEKEEAPEQR